MSYMVPTRVNQKKCFSNYTNTEANTNNKLVPLDKISNINLE